MTRFYLFC